jgi:hypothetical protein
MRGVAIGIVLFVAPQDRKLVENIDAVSIPQFENCIEVK